MRWVGWEGSFKGKEVCSKDVFVLSENGKDGEETSSLDIDRKKN